MKKVLISIAAVAVMAIAPSSALAVGGWGGWDTEHSDNVAGLGYFTELEFMNHGLGDSRYCVAPFAPAEAPDDPPSLLSPLEDISDDQCTGQVVVKSPLVFTGVFCGVGGATCGAGTGATGCNHDDNETVPEPADGDPCGSADLLGAFYVGTGPTGDDRAPNGALAANGVYVDTTSPCSPDDTVCLLVFQLTSGTPLTVGVGLQG